MEALAQRSGVSTGALSQLERGQANPSLQTVQRLATALGLPVTQLLEAAPPADHLVVRADARPRLPAPGDVPAGEAAVRELLTPAGGRLQVIRTEVPPGASNEAGPYRHLGQECVVVLDGRLTVGVGGEVLELGPGDAITYDCTVPHWWANRTDRATVVLGAVTPLAF